MLAITQLAQAVGGTAVAPWSYDIITPRDAVIFLIGGAIALNAFGLIFTKFALLDKGESLTKVIRDEWRGGATVFAFFYALIVIAPLLVIYATDGLFSTTDTQPVHQQLKTYGITIDERELATAIRRSVDDPVTQNVLKDGEVTQLTISSVRSEGVVQGGKKEGDYTVTWKLN